MGCSGASGSWIARDIGLPSCRENDSALPSHGTGQRPVPDSGGRADRQSGQPQRRLDLLLTLHQEGRTILIVTHDETSGDSCLDE